MNRAERILEQLDDITLPGFNPEVVLRNINQQLERLGYEGVTVSNVNSDHVGNIFVTFKDDEGNEMDTSFAFDENTGMPMVTLLDAEDELNTILLDDKNLPATNTPAGLYVNFNDVSWLDGELLSTILGVEEPTESYVECKDDIEEITKTVVRGGKKVRVKLVRRKKKRLTPKQRAGIRKAARKRKRTAKTATSKRKRAKSLKLRKRAKLKRTKGGSKLKVSR